MNIDLNIVCALMPHYVGQFRVVVAKMIAEENMRRIVADPPKPTRFDARRGVETR
jgi:hypothetical protein